MVFTTLLFAVFLRQRLHWSYGRVVPLIAIFRIADLAFWGATIVKVPQGGWFALAIALGIVILMTTWKRGRSILSERLRAQSLPFDVFIEDVKRREPTRVAGTAVFMYGNPSGTPPGETA